MHVKGCKCGCMLNRIFPMSILFKESSTYRDEEQHNAASRKVHHPSVPMSNPQQLILSSSLSYNPLLRHILYQLDCQNRYKHIIKVIKVIFKCFLYACTIY